MLAPLLSLPVSPYPVPAGTPIRAHFVSETRPKEDGWKPWIGDTWSKWVQGTVLGYRDFSGREAMVGPLVPVAQDALAKGRHGSLERMMHFPICSFNPCLRLAPAGVRL
jgi:hypothetical protein